MTSTELASTLPPTSDVACEATGFALWPFRADTRHEQFVEVIETETTRDHVDDDGVFLRPPPGPGWRVLDAHHRERHTKMAAPSPGGARLERAAQMTTPRHGVYTPAEPHRLVSRGQPRSRGPPMRAAFSETRPRN
jgi:hypothetical protein